MAADIAIKGTADIEVIKHRIYEVRDLRLKSQYATSTAGNLAKGGDFDHLFMANPSKSMGLQIKQQR